jgi:hypothetical protein
MTDSDSTERPSVDKAERDVAETRADLRDTLDALENRLSPEAMMDQTIAYFRGDGRHYMARVGTEARDNPLPVIMMGIGAAWLAYNVSRRLERDTVFASRQRVARSPDPFDDDPALMPETVADAEPQVMATPVPGATVEPVTSDPSVKFDRK